MIKDFTDDYSIHGEKFLVVNAIVCKSAKGGKYLNIKLQDSSDVIEAKKWNATDDDETILRRGNIVRIHGVVSIYNKNLQLNIESAEICDSDNLDNYIVSSPLSEKYLRDEVARLFDSMQDEDLKLVLSEFLHKYDKQYFIYPSAVTNHHDYLRGLVTHSLTMAHLCVSIVEEYKLTGIELNKDLLICGALLHDIGKISEFTSEILPEYSTEGKLLGHISIGSCEIHEICEKLHIDHEKTMLLQHMILSHHGQYDFGSPVLPMTKEALILSMVDNLDAKLVMFDKEINNLLQEGTFTDRMAKLDNRSIYKPKK